MRKTFLALILLLLAVSLCAWACAEEAAGPSRPTGMQLPLVTNEKARPGWETVSARKRNPGRAR